MIAALLVLGYVGLCGVLYVRQGELLYPGTSDVNPAGFTSFRIQSGGADIKVWSLHANAGPALLYFGGNGEDVGARLAEFDRALIASIPTALRHSILIPNGTHSDLGDYQRYLAMVRAFIEGTR